MLQRFLPPSTWLTYLAVINQRSQTAKICPLNSVYYIFVWQIVVVQLPSLARLFATPRIAACQASLSLTISQSLPKFMFTTSVMPSSHLIQKWCSLLLLPSIFSNTGDFSNESAVHIRWPKYWSFSFSLSPSNKYSGLITLKIDWFWSPCCPRDFQESSLTPQLKGINSSALCLLYDPTLTTMRDHWEDHSGGLAAKFCPTLVIPWTVARQAPLSLGFSRQEYWSGLPFPSPGDLPNPGIKPRSPAL